MLPNATLRRPARILMLLIVGLALIGLAPQPPASAQDVGEIQYLDNTQGQFANGVFERTSISPERSTTISEDVAGAVLLAPAGILTPWDTSIQNLPSTLSNGGIVALKNFLYLLTGETDAGVSDKAQRAIVDQRNGRLQTDATSGQVWKSYTITPAVASRLPGCETETTAARTRATATATEIGSATTTGYIYLIGGVVNLGCEGEVTTPLVQIGVVDANGEITSWVRAPDLPTAEGTTVAVTPLGVADAMATVVRTSANQRFLYVVGGYSTNPAAITQDVIYKSAFYAKINPANGTLVHPTNGSTTSPWARAADVSFVDGDPDGVRDGTLIAARASKLDNTASPPAVIGKDGIYLAGGCFDLLICATRNNYVLRADINPSTGALTWDTSIGGNGTENAGLAGRSGLAGVAYNNKLYMVGGTTTGTTSGGVFNVPTAFYDADLNLLPLAGANDFFVGTGSTEQVIPGGTNDSGRRSEASVTVMQALPPTNEADVTVNSAWVYVAGGFDDTGDRKDTLFIGKVGGADEAADTVRTRDGWYYSSVEPVLFQGKLARVLSIRWTSLIDRSQNPNADIRIEFRKTITGDSQCQEDDFDPSAVATNPDRWRLIDGDTASGFYSLTNDAAKPFNIVKMVDVFGNEQIEATCLQFRAQLLQNGPDVTQTPVTPNATPRLLSFSLEKVLAGNAELKLDDLQVKTIRGGVSEVVVKVQNLSPQGVDSTLSVLEAVGEGSFFVNLCYAYAAPGQPAPALSLPQPQKNGPRPACSKAYYEIFNYQMEKGITLLLNGKRANPNQGWVSNGADLNSSADDVKLDNVRQLFTQPGTYRVGIIIDYNNLIPEGTIGELNNRGETEAEVNGRTILVTITAAPGDGLFLPMILN